MTHLPNDFAPARPPSDRPKPRLSDAARAVVEAGTPISPDHPLFGEIREHLRHSKATRFDLLEVVRGNAEQMQAMTTRIANLEKALAFAQEAAATAAEEYLHADT